MPGPRAEAPATVLQNGDVLLAGGSNGQVVNTAVLYHPSTGTWSTTAGIMTTHRHGHSQTLLASGQVLIAGGSFNSAELYDPLTQTFTATGSMASWRENFGSALLPNGKVLVAGGNPTTSCAGATADAEIYDPSTSMWSSAGSMSVPRNKTTATLLPSGKVLVAGGTIEVHSVDLGFGRSL